MCDMLNFARSLIGLYLWEIEGGLGNLKWELSSIDRYIEAKEYIDTALIPIIQVKMDDELKHSVADSTWIMGVAGSIEEQLTGRVMLFPYYTYTGLEEEVHLFSSLNTYAAHVKKNGFDNVIFLTHNDSWTALEGQLEAKALTILREKPDSLDVSKAEMDEYAQRIVPKLIKFWEKG